MSTDDRNANTTTVTSPDQVNFFDAGIHACPYPAYQVLRDQAPVWRDPLTGLYVITRYEDLREILLDPAHFSNQPQGEPRAIMDPERAKRMRALYREKGWLPGATLAQRDNPNHKQMRAMFDNAFRPGRIKELEPFIEQLAYRLVDTFINDGHCDWVKQFAVPFPLIIIGKQMGAPEEDIWRIKAWTDAWIKRLGLMQSEDDERASVEQEIEAQHYFQPIFERLRKQPDGTLLSDLVNTVIPEWGRSLTDEELHAEMMADTFVGGSETTTNALSAGVMLLVQNPDVWARLKAEPDKYLRTFIEEVLRLESPVQGLLRYAASDIELHGVTIPKGAMVNVRYAAANRDEREFDCPQQLNLDRAKPGSHLAFGSGVHHCLGAPLARRELWWGFKALLDRIDELRFAPQQTDFTYQSNFMLRALDRLQIEFTHHT